MYAFNGRKFDVTAFRRVLRIRTLELVAYVGPDQVSSQYVYVRSMDDVLVNGTLKMGTLCHGGTLELAVEEVCRVLDSEAARVEWLHRKNEEISDFAHRYR